MAEITTDRPKDDQGRDLIMDRSDRVIGALSNMTAENRAIIMDVVYRTYCPWCWEIIRGKACPCTVDHDDE